MKIQGMRDWAHSDKLALLRVLLNDVEGLGFEERDEVLAAFAEKVIPCGSVEAVTVVQVGAIPPAITPAGSDMLPLSPNEVNTIAYLRRVAAQPEVTGICAKCYRSINLGARLCLECSRRNVFSGGAR